MKFIDAVRFLALLNPRDTWHARAREVNLTLRERLVTTMWILTEVADGLAATPCRSIVPAFVQQVCAAGNIEVIPPEAQWFFRGLTLYGQRPDKAWSLTDCISFEVMRERGITEALTADHHFEQARFRILLKE